MDFISVVPAYGHEYRTQADVKAGFKAGHDFKIVDTFHGRGRYVNVNDLPDGAKLDVHYGKDGTKRLIVP